MSKLTEQHPPAIVRDEEKLDEPSPPRRSRFACVLLAFVGLVMLAHVLRPSTIGTARHWCAGRLRKQSSAAAALPSHYMLPSGDKIPAVALGVWQAAPNEVGKAVEAALKAGYRHIDGAWAYRNEKEVGAAIRSSGVKVRV
jgi:hypothetical protein